MPPVAFPALETQLSREDLILLSAIHPRPTAEQQDELLRLLATSIDWTRLFDQADRHDVVPMLYLRLQKLPSRAIPPEVQIRFARRAHACLAWNLRLRHVLLQLLRLFNQAEVPVMPLKGVLLAELLYGDCALRPTNDLDLLVQEKDIENAVHVLLAAGCRRLLAPEQETELYHYLFSFGPGDETDVLIELHRDFTSAHLARLDVQKAWAAATLRVWEQRIVWTMRTDDMFLYLCTHAMRDGLGSVKTLLDVALMIEQYGATWYWEDLVKSVHATHIQTPVWLTLWQCQQLFAVAVPNEFLDAIRPTQGLGWRLGHALFTWRGGVLHSPLALLRSPMGTLLSFLWEDSWRGKIKHVRRMFLPTAGLRSRRTGLPAATSIMRGYLHWLWHSGRQLAEQIVLLRRVRNENK